MNESSELESEGASVEPLAELENSKEFRDIKELVDELGPDIEQLTKNLQELEQSKGKRFINSRLGQLGTILATSGSFIAIMMATLGQSAVPEFQVLGGLLSMLGGIGIIKLGTSASRETYNQDGRFMTHEMPEKKEELARNIEEFKAAVREARAMTTEALLEGGATWETVHTVDEDGISRTHQELRATLGQVEHARQEAEKDGVDIVRPEDEQRP